MATAKQPKGYQIGTPIDVVSTQESLQRLWRLFEESFPAQVGNDPTLSKRGLIWYTTNGKQRRTRVVKLFERIASELGSLAGDVRQAARLDASGEPMRTPSKRKAKGKAKSKPRTIAKTTGPVTAETISMLRQEASSAGDQKMVKICDRALKGSKPAIAECARVISAARAMR
jgi:hypothetical protein